jgi:hypothetical protein
MLEAGPSANPDLLRQRLIGVDGIGEKSVVGIMESIAELGGVPGDLTEIKGVGPVLAEAIRANGVL